MCEAFVPKNVTGGPLRLLRSFLGSSGPGGKGPRRIANLRVYETLDLYIGLRVAVQALTLGTVKSLDADSPNHDKCERLGPFRTGLSCSTTSENHRLRSRIWCRWGDDINKAVT